MDIHRDVLAEKYSHAELLLKTQSDKVDSLQDKIWYVRSQQFEGQANLV